MVKKCIFIVDLRNEVKQPEEVCQLLRREFNEYLIKGYPSFEFIVVTPGKIYEWLDYIKCVIEYNIVATIVVKQVSAASEELLREAKKVSNSILVKTIG